MRLLAPAYFLALSSLWITSCNPSQSIESDTQGGTVTKPHISASNTPLAYFAHRIGGELITVDFPGPDDEDPAFWVPSDEAIETMQESDLILLNGATYEKWLPQVTLPESKLVDTSASFSDAYLESGETSTHSHGPAGDHSHTGTAFITWIDFQQAKTQAVTIHAALVSLLPDQTESLDQGLQGLSKDLDALHRRMSVIAKRIGPQALIASHPVYQYWARCYGLNVKELLWEPEVIPNESQWADLKQLVEEHPAKTLIWEGTPAAASVEKLDAMGIESLVFDPCGGPPDQGDWLEVMKSNLDGLESHFPDR